MTVRNDTAAERLAQFVVAMRYEDIPKSAINWAKQGIIDTIGVALAGTTLPDLSGALLEYAKSAPGFARVMGSRGIRSTPEVAALVAGTLAHALDFDDVGFAMWAHPSAPLTAVMLALGDSMSVTGVEALEAYVVGYEVEAAIGKVCAADHFTKGWHTTSTLGTIGAAAAAARLRRLDVEATTHALAIASSMAAGVQANIGSMTKPLHAGLAAHNGLIAAGLAAAGIRGSLSAIDGEKGFIAVFGSGGISPFVDLEDLGRRFDLAEIGLGFKIYPSCAGTHRVIDGILDMVESDDIKPDEVSRVVCDVAKRSLIPLVHQRPRTALEAKFSLEYAAAIAITDRRAGLRQYSDARVGEPDARRLLDRIEVRIHPEQTEGGTIETEFAEVTIELHDGRRVHRRIDVPRGFPALPLGSAEFEEKFRETAACYLGAGDVEELLATLRQLDAVSSLDDVIGLVS